MGTALPDAFVGTDTADFFDLSEGTGGPGNTDVVNGGGGDDAVYFGDTFDNTDVVDGGTGRDQIGLQGDYSAGVTLTNVTNVEELILLPGNDTRFGDTAGNSYSYNVTTSENTVASGQRLTVDGNRLRGGENLTFNGSAETDGSFFIYGGMGTDVLTGGSQNDVFFFRGGRFQDGDVINGGGGAIDQVALRGDYSSQQTVEGGTFNSVEGLVVISSQDTRFGRAEATPFSYDIFLGAGAVTGVSQFTVDAGTLRSNETLTFDASSENVSMRIFGGRGNDRLTGSQMSDNIRGNAGNDTITGGLAGDRLDGGAGSDTFFYNVPSESTSTRFDTIVNFNVEEDFADLPTPVFGFTNFIFGGRLDQSTFDADLATAVNMDLEPFTAVTYSPDSGSFAGRDFVIVDSDGDGDYTPDNDFVFEILNPTIPLDPTINFFI
jgi:Ca2+-binding RTX toxin-like protein